MNVTGSNFHTDKLESWCIKYSFHFIVSGLYTFGHFLHPSHLEFFCPYKVFIYFNVKQTLICWSMMLQKCKNVWLMCTALKACKKLLLSKTLQFLSLCTPPTFVHVSHFNDICQKQEQWKIIFKPSNINVWSIF